jgi:hypothetical protein
MGNWKNDYPGPCEKYHMQHEDASMNEHIAYSRAFYHNPMKRKYHNIRLVSSFHVIEAKGDDGYALISPIE